MNLVSILLLNIFVNSILLLWMIFNCSTFYIYILSLIYFSQYSKNCYSWAFWILIYCLLPGTLHCFHNNATYIKTTCKAETIMFCKWFVSLGTHTQLNFPCPQRSHQQMYLVFYSEEPFVPPIYASWKYCIWLYPRIDKSPKRPSNFGVLLLLYD